MRNDLSRSNLKQPWEVAWGGFIFWWCQKPFLQISVEIWKTKPWIFNASYSEWVFLGNICPVLLQTKSFPFENSFKVSPVWCICKTRCPSSGLCVPSFQMPSFSELWTGISSLTSIEKAQLTSKYCMFQFHSWYVIEKLQWWQCSVCYVD